MSYLASLDEHAFSSFCALFVCLTVSFSKYFMYSVELLANGKWTYYDMELEIGIAVRLYTMELFY